MEECRAFVYAGIEDFGIAPVEAMAAGAPVIAYGKAGILDTVNCITSESNNPTGLIYKNQSYQTLRDCINYFEEKKLWKNEKTDNNWKSNNLEIIISRMKGWQLETFKESYRYKKDNGISLFKKNLKEKK